MAFINLFGLLPKSRAGLSAFGGLRETDAPESCHSHVIQD
jgi:hypothetical protein